MNRPFHKIWKETLLIALCFLLLGGFLLFKPEATKDFFAFLSGAFLLMLGLLSFIKHRSLGKMITFDLAYALVCGIGAIILFVNRSIIFQVIPWVLGVLMITNCIFKLRYIFELKKAKIEKWYFSLILACVKLVLGIIMILGNDMFGETHIMQMIGWFSIIFAILDVVDVVLIKWYLDEPISEKERLKIMNGECKEIDFDEDA